MYKLINLKLVVFKSFKILIINSIFKNLSNLMLKYDLKTIYTDEQRNGFYCKRSAIVSPYHYYFKNDKLFLKALEQFSVHYVVSRKYHQDRQCYVLEIGGYSSFFLYKESPIYSSYSKIDLIHQIGLKEHAYKF